MSIQGDIHVPHGSTEGEIPAETLTGPQETVPVLFVIPVVGGAAGSTDKTVRHKIRVVDAWAIHTGGAGETSDTIQVLNGANAITDAMDWSGADQAVVRAGTINDANHEIAAGGTLRVTTVDSDTQSDVGAGVVYVLGVRAR